jgi:hypothetical protein
MEKLYGTYIGKVVDNNDPIQGGRVRVFCSHPSIGNYYASQLNKLNIIYKFPGNEDFDANFIKIIREYLPWSRVISPITGGSAPGKFDAANNFASRSSNVINFDNSDQTIYNSDGYEITPMEALRAANVNDAFAFPEATMVPNGNPYGATDYMAPTYASKPSGQFNIPRVGSTVAIQFTNGDINKPIVIGSANDTETLKIIMNDGDIPIGVPGDFENI